jgi:glyoxylase-like metal-dependent hydrolase (beta-lactamase superfamily II)
MIESTLTTVVADRIWSLERPVWFSGTRLRARTTVVRLDDRSLLLHTPAPPTDALAEELRALGPVRWLVVPNCWHHLGAPAAAARFPEARLVGPASAQRRNRILRLDLDLHDGQFGKLVPEFDALPLAGVPFWDETLLYHRPTQTLLGADIVCSASADDHFTWRFGARITGCYERVRVPPDARKKLEDKAATARSLLSMLQRPAERLIIGHGDIIENGCRDQLAHAWRLEGVEV